MTHGPHQLAQTLMRRSFFASPRAIARIAASSTTSRLTGSCAHLSRPSFTEPRLSDHLTEQPNVFVVSTATGLPASTASIASRASWVFAFAGFSLSSTRPA